MDNLDKYIPKRLKPHVVDAYKDSDGYWVEFDDSVHVECNDSYTIHEDTIEGVKAALKTCKIQEATWAK